MLLKESVRSKPVNLQVLILLMHCIMNYMLGGEKAREEVSILGRHPTNLATFVMLNSKIPAFCSMDVIAIPWSHNKLKFFVLHYSIDVLGGVKTCTCFEKGGPRSLSFNGSEQLVSTFNLLLLTYLRVKWFGGFHCLL